MKILKKPYKLQEVFGFVVVFYFFLFVIFQCNSMQIWRLSKTCFQVSDYLAFINVHIKSTTNLKVLLDSTKYLCLVTDSEFFLKWKFLMGTVFMNICVIRTLTSSCYSLILNSGGVLWKFVGVQVSMASQKLSCVF